MHPTPNSGAVTAAPIPQPTAAPPMAPSAELSPGFVVHAARASIAAEAKTIFIKITYWGFTIAAPGRQQSIDPIQLSDAACTSTARRRTLAGGILPDPPHTSQGFWYWLKIGWRAASFSAPSRSMRPEPLHLAQSGYDAISVSDPNNRAEDRDDGSIYAHDSAARAYCPTRTGDSLDRRRPIYCLATSNPWLPHSIR
jgi:hypothetical protein